MFIIVIFHSPFDLNFENFFSCKTTDGHHDRRKLLIMHQERMIHLHDENTFQSNNSDDYLNFLHDMDRFPQRYPTECNFQEMCRV